LKTWTYQKKQYTSSSTKHKKPIGQQAENCIQKNRPNTLIITRDCLELIVGNI
jgi:hypothetical protein